MQREQLSWRSPALGREMPLVVYGDAGWPLVVFPTQNSPCTDYESFGMVDELSDFVEGGRVQLFCVDSVDRESWSAEGFNPESRANLQEAFFAYVCEEVVPFVRDRNGSQRRPLATGCSMGATHALIAALRRPDLFEGCIALSGVYDARHFFGDWMNETLYHNSPVHFLPNMPLDHEYVQLYRRRQLVLCVGQGAWEEEGVRTQRIVQAALERIDAGAWCDYWGFDVNHDWPWWKKQMRYFLPIVLERLGA